MRLKSVLRYDKSLRMFRVARLLLRRRPDIGGHTAKLSLAFWPKLFRWAKDWREWDLTVLGIRVHYQSGGGIHV